MKFKASFLFYILAIISVLLIPILCDETLDFNVHDTYFVLGYFHYLAAIFVMSILTGLAYSLMNHLNKPIKLSTAIIHFIAIILGLVFSINFYGLIVMCTLTRFVPDTTAFAFDRSSLLSFLLGPLFLLVGLIVFIFGLIRAIIRN